MNARKSLELVRFALLFAFGLAVALHFGRRGFMPLDQSICFDGGWRILGGQVPFRDYTAPNGFSVHALQALFFAVLGVSWFAYVLHAAVINGIFVVLVDRLLVLLGLEGWASSVFALCSALLLYPPFGVPYMDQHAFFFSLAALVAAVACASSANSASINGSRAQRWCAWSVFPLLALAYLSKQIPSVFFAPVVLAAPLFAGHCRSKLYRWIGIGALVSLLVVLGLALLLGVDWELVDTYYRRLPSEEGARRLGYVPSVAAVLDRFVETLQQWQFRSAWMALCLAAPSALIASVLTLRRRDVPWRLPLASALCALFLLFASLLFVALTSNQKEIGLPLVFASSGAALASVFGLARIASDRFPRAPWLARGFVALFAWLALDDTLRYAREVVATRSVNDTAFDDAVADAAAPELPAELAYLRWSVPKRVPYSPSDLRELTEYLREREGSFLLLGDTSILYGLARKPSLAPSLWFHPGLTLPTPFDAEFARYEATLVERVEHASAIVLEGEHPWIGYQLNPGEKPPKAGWVTLELFPRLKAQVDARKTGERTFGPFRVIELRAP